MIICCGTIFSINVPLSTLGSTICPGVLDALSLALLYKPAPHLRHHAKHCYHHVAHFTAC